MPRVTHVKSARKANPRYGIEKGDEYWHWAFMVGGRGGPKICSKTYPKPSQLTQSEFLSSLYSEQESLDEAQDADAFESVGQAIRDLGEEQQGKYDNMPDGLQQGDTGQLLEERANGCSEWADEIDRVAGELRESLTAREALRAEWSDYDEQAEVDREDDADEPEEPGDERPPEDDTDLIDEARDEITGACPF